MRDRIAFWLLWPSVALLVVAPIVTALLSSKPDPAARFVEGSLLDLLGPIVYLGATVTGVLCVALIASSRRARQFHAVPVPYVVPLCLLALVTVEMLVPHVTLALLMPIVLLLSIMSLVQALRFAFERHRTSS